jgi:Putative auto-transporter adhesin, head GIN domain
MKTQMLSAVFASAALLTGSFAFSNDAKPITTTTREIALKSSFQKIAVGCNLQVVLVQDAIRSTVIITGDETVVPAINVSIDKSVLSITSRKNLKNKKIKIYVPVTTLTSLDLASEASVATEGVLKLDSLKVMVHEGSKVALNVIGNLQIEPADDCDLVYEKFEKTKVIYVQQ